MYPRMERKWLLFHEENYLLVMQRENLLKKFNVALRKE